MSNPAQEHLFIAEEKLRRFLALAEEILALKAALKQRLDEALQAGAFTETLRTSTIIGLHLKALDCFDRLIIDVRDRRGEASHHLKTMVECFIYSHWVSCDEGETRARLLSAEGYRSRAAYHESLEEKEYAATWREMPPPIEAPTSVAGPSASSSRSAIRSAGGEYRPGASGERPNPRRS